MTHRAASRRTRAAGRPTPDRDTECALLYTSGTTGRPKGCMLSNAYFLARRRVVRRLGDAVLGAAAIASGCITPLPLNHMNAMAFSTMAMLVAGGCLVQLDRFHPQDLVAERAREPRDHHPLPRRDAGDADRRAPARRRPRARVRWGFGAGVDRKNHAPFEERFGFPLIEAWAMTETGAGG